MNDWKSSLGCWTLTFALGACGGSGATSGESGGQSSAGGDALAAYEGPIACDEADMRGMNGLYGALCKGCHTSYAPALADIGWGAADMRRQIREGEGSMPGFNTNQISDGQLECMLVYLQDMGAVSEEP